MHNKTINDVYSELSSIVSRTYSKIGNQILIRTERGIVVYNKYAIFKTKSGIKLALRDGQQDVIPFNSAKNALIWILLYHHNKIYESKRVYELDTFIYSAEIEAEIHKRGQKTKDPEKYLINYSKHQTDVAKQKQFLKEIDKYYILAQTCQQQGTKHEIK